MPFARLTRSLAPLAAAALAALAACSDGTGPAPNLDPVAAQADAQAMMDAFNAPTLQQFQAVSGYMEDGTTPAAAAVRGARQLLAGGKYVTQAEMGRIAGAVAGGFLKSTSPTGMTLSREASLPAEMLGTTFVYDPSVADYVASDRTGAPDNGVRFVLYAIDPLTGDPVVETEVGRVDVIDLNPSGANVAGIRLLVVGGSTTYLDYTVTAAAGLTSATISVAGYLTDGTTRVNFTTVMRATQQSSGTGTVRVEYGYEIPTRQFGVRGAVEGYISGEEAFARMTITVVSRGATVKYVFEGDGSTLDVSVYVNNRLFATIAGSGGTITIQGAGGRELTQDEMQALHKLLDVAEYSTMYFVVLMAPVGMLGSDS